MKDETLKKLKHLIAVVGNEPVAYDLKHLQESIEKNGDDGLCGFSFNKGAFKFEHACGSVASYPYSVDGVKNFVGHMHMRKQGIIEGYNEQMVEQVATSLFTKQVALSSLVTAVGTSYAALALLEASQQITDGGLKFDTEVFTYDFDQGVQVGFDLNDMGVEQFVKLLESKVRLDFISQFEKRHHKDLLTVLAPVANEGFEDLGLGVYNLSTGSNKITVNLETQPHDSILDTLYQFVGKSQYALREEIA